MNFSNNLTVVDQLGNKELGIGDGVMTDGICTFDINLAYQHLIVSHEKARSLRHDIGLQQWNSAAGNSVYGSKLNYFLLFLSSIFLTVAFFGGESIRVVCFIDGFKKYVSAE